MGFVFLIERYNKKKLNIKLFSLLKETTMFSKPLILVYVSLKWHIVLSKLYVIDFGIVEIINYNCFGKYIYRGLFRQSLEMKLIGQKGCPLSRDYLRTRRRSEGQLKQLGYHLPMWLQIHLLSTSSISWFTHMKTMIINLLFMAMAKPRVCTN